MKIIDYKKYGNVIRFYYGDDDEEDYYGDDWNDTPYEHNAGTVYDKYIKGYIDIAITPERVALEAKDDWRWGGNSPYCKNDMKDRNVPCIVIISADNTFGMEDCFTNYASSDNDEVIKIYFGDTDEDLIMIEDIVVLQETVYH